jgi:putative ABC transport system permease protein
MAIGNGAASSITNEIEGNGANLLNIMSGMFQPPEPGKPFIPTEITYRDYLALSKTLTHIAGIAPAYQSGYTVTQGTISTSTAVTGITEDYITVHTQKIETGRGINANDRARQNQVAVLGATSAKNLFPNTGALGGKIKIDNSTYTVIGVLKSKGSLGFDNQDDVVFIPLETGYSKLFGSNAMRNGEKIISVIAVSASSAATVKSVEEQITFVLRHTHHLAMADQNDFYVMNQADLLSSLTNVTTTMTVFLGSIAALSLLVGGIGIMNITLVSVSERTREIGLRKAVGARKGHILLQFLIETMTLSVSGGLIGILFGLAIAGVVTLSGLITAKVTLSSILMSFFFSMGIGLFFGIYPAFRAANLHPMEALRSE